MNSKRMSDASDPGSGHRLPHAILDLASRQWKAIKIERLLQLDQMPRELRILEVGTGSGGIAEYFAAHPSGRFTVDAVDVVDNRQVVGSFSYTLVSDAVLPFPDECFDVVLSNHVIEHVGNEAQQMVHLSELRRVMRPGAIGYMAVPNRWMLVEPHYQIAFLSWLPKSLRSPYLRLRGKGELYDCEPLQMRQLEEMLSRSDLCSENICVPAMRLTLEIERPESSFKRLLDKVPDSLLQPIRAIIPTLIYRFWRSKP